jgi:hypothetical protein
LGGLVRRDPHLGELLEQSRGLGIADRVHLGGVHAQFFHYFDWRQLSCPARLALRYDPREGYFLRLGKQISKITLISFTKKSEVIPTSSNIGTDVKHYNTLVARVSWLVLCERAHNTANKLDEWT